MTRSALGSKALAVVPRRPARVFAALGWAAVLGLAAAEEARLVRFATFPVEDRGSREAARAERGRRRLAGQQLVPLHTGEGTHFIYIYVGTPPQRTSVILDTGSHHTAFPCDGCDQCGSHTDPYFNRALSATMKTLDCTECQNGAVCKAASKSCILSQHYTEGSSWTAELTRDQIWLDVNLDKPDPSAELAVAGDGPAPGIGVPFLFGCQTRETKLFTTQVENGIMGLSMSKKTLLPQLLENGIIDHNAFSLCFNETGGVLTVGGMDPSLNQEDLPVLYTPLRKDGTPGDHFYVVEIEDVLLGGRSLGPRAVGAMNSRPGCILDSGTSDTYLPRGLHVAFVEAWRKAGVDWSYAVKSVKLTKEEMLKLPTITFVFAGGAKLEVPPASYMEPGQIDGIYTPRVYLTEQRGAVLGANAFNRHDILFDVENARVGIIPSTCEPATLDAKAANGPGERRATTEAMRGRVLKHTADVLLHWIEFFAGPSDAEVEAKKRAAQKAAAAGAHGKAIQDAEAATEWDERIEEAHWFTYMLVVIVMGVAMFAHCYRKAQQENRSSREGKRSGPRSRSRSNSDRAMRARHSPPISYLRDKDTGSMDEV